MNFHMEKLMKQLMNVANRVKFRKPKSTALVDVSKVQLIPKSHRRSGRAYFAPCLYRRQGYVALMAPIDYLRLTTTRPIEGNFSGYDALEEQWLRGLTWQPFPLNIKHGPSGWVVAPPFYSDSMVRAAFLHRKGQRVVRVQLLPDSVATYEAASELSDSGLLGYYSDQRPALLIGVKVTL